MVIFLVVLTVGVFLLAEWYLVTARRKTELRATLSARAAPDETGRHPADPLTHLLFHPGHSWVRFEADGKDVVVGTSDFASSFAGEIFAVELPGEGTSLRQGEPAWTVTSRRGRRLTQVIPLDGRVIAVNRELVRNPGLLQRSPYGEGWILRLRPRRLQQGLRNLIQGLAARSWMDAIRSTVSRRYSPALGSLAQDGGDWAAGFGDLLPEEDWEELQTELFPIT